MAAMLSRTRDDENDRDDDVGDRVGQVACDRDDLVEALPNDDRAGEAEIERRLTSLIPTPGAQDESWHLQQLRLLHNFAVDEEDRSSPAVCSSSEHAAERGGIRTTTHEPGQDGRTIETELYWRGTRLIWSRSSIVVRVFTFDDPVRWACWAWLDTDDTRADVKGARKACQVVQRALCIFLPTSMQIHIPHTGQEFVKRLEMDVLNVFALDAGLIIQRRLEREDRRRLVQTHKQQSDSLIDARFNRTFSRVVDEPLPSLFYLRRPLDELRAMQLADELTYAEKDEARPISVSRWTCWTRTPTMHTFNEVDERVLFVSQSIPEEGAQHRPTIMVTASVFQRNVRIYHLAHSSHPFSASVMARTPAAPNVMPKVRHKTQVNARISQGAAALPGGHSGTAMRPRFSSARGRMPSFRGNQRGTESASRASSGSAPRTSIIGSNAAERVRSASGASRRVSGSLGNLYNTASSTASMANPGSSEDPTGEAADETGVQEVMQLLDELDEGEQHVEFNSVSPRRFPVLSGTSMRRRNSRAYGNNSAIPSAAAAAQGQATAAPQAMRTPYAKTPTRPSFSSEGRRTASRPRKSSALDVDSGGADSFVPSSMAATLSQRDEESRLAQSSSRYKRPSLAHVVNKKGRTTLTHMKDVADVGQDDKERPQELPIFEQSGCGFAAVALIDEIACARLNTVGDLKRITVVERAAQECGGLALRIGLPFDGVVVEREVAARPHHYDGQGRTASKRYESRADAASAEATPTRTQSGPDALVKDVIFALGAVDSDKSHGMQEAMSRQQAATSGLSQWDAFLRTLGCHLYGPKPAQSSAQSSWEMMLQRVRRAPSNVLLDSTSLPHLQEPTTDEQRSATGTNGFLTSNAELAQMMAVLNVVAEELRLDTQRIRADLFRIASLIVRLAVQLNWPHWVDKWVRLCALNVDTLPTSDSSHRSIQEPKPFDLYDVLWLSLRGEAANWKPIVSLPLTATLTRIFSAFARPSSAFKTVSGRLSTEEEQRARSVMDAVVHHHLDDRRVRRLPFAIALPIFEARQTCKVDPPARWSVEAYLRVGRRDLALQMSHKVYASGPNVNSSAARQVARRIEQSGDKASRMPNLPAICLQLFNKDYRLADVANMLQTARAVATKGPSESNASQLNEELIAEQQKRIFVSVSDRLKATSVGRGMFMLASEPVRTAEQLKIPPVCLRIRMLCHCIVQHREPDAESAEMEWPEFHNGTAAALQLSTDGVQIESSWLYSQTNSEFTSRNAGFVFGMGLLGQLRNLGKIHAHHYLSNRHSPTTIGLLLGIAVSFAGSCDVMAKALMSIHLVHTLPMHSKPLKTSMLEQSAAMLGLGFIFLGSSDRWASRMALKAMGTELVMTDDSQMARRECFSLSAGFALGLVCLGRGRDGAGSVDLERDLVPDLERLIKPFTASSGGRSDARQADKDAAETARQAADYAAFEWRPDVALTSTPATLALTLMYLRSNRQDVADKLVLPINEAQLDEIRPEILQIRLLGRALIMWEEIGSSQSWIDSVLPDFLRRQKVECAEGACRLAHCNLRAGAVMAIGLKYAGTNDAVARRCLLQELTAFQGLIDARSASFDGKVLQQALRSAVDVSLTCLSMVCAGSGDVELMQIIRNVLFRKSAMHYGNYMASTMAIGMLFLGAGRYTLASTDTAVAVLLIALYPRYPINAQDNRAHMQAYRHLWVMAVEARLLSVEDVDSGETSSTPIVIHLKTESKSVVDSCARSAAKLTSTPCVLPQLGSVKAIHLDSGRYYAAALNVGQNGQHRRALAEAQTLFAMRHAAVLSYECDGLGRGSVMGQLDGMSSELPIPKDTLQGEIQSELSGQTASIESHRLARRIEVLTDRRMIAALTQVVAGLDNFSSEQSPSARQEHLQLFTTHALLECLQEDKLEMLPAFIGLYAQVRSAVENDSRSLGERSIFAQDFAFLRRLVAHDNVRVATKQRSPLIAPSFVERLALTMDKARARCDYDGNPAYAQISLTSYAFAMEGGAATLARTPSRVAVLLAEAGVPPLAVLEEVKRFVREQSGGQQSHPPPHVICAALHEAELAVSHDVLDSLVTAWCATPLLRAD